MIFRKIASSLLSLIILGFFLSANAQEVKTDTPSSVPKPVYKKLETGDFTFQWRIDDEDMLHVKVSAPTTGWIAVGFNPSKMMADADYIMGYIKDGKAYFSDEYGNGNTSHKPDIDLGGTDDIGEKEGFEKEGSTTIHFSIPLESGDAYDKLLKPGGKVKLLLAYGTKDDFKSYHKKRTSVELESL